MTRHSAGILLYKFIDDDLYLMLVHPGGPFWAGKDLGAWSIPKGLIENDEAPLAAARREFREETGFEAKGEPVELGRIRQPSGKIVHAWAVEQDLDVSKMESNTFTLEWPVNSGRIRDYPEVDQGEWFRISEARRKITKGQAGFIDALVKILDVGQ